MVDFGGAAPRRKALTLTSWFEAELVDAAASAGNTAAPVALVESMLETPHGGRGVAVIQGDALLRTLIYDGIGLFWIAGEHRVLPVAAEPLPLARSRVENLLRDAPAVDELEPGDLPRPRPTTLAGWPFVLTTEPRPRRAPTPWLPPAAPRGVWTWLQENESCLPAEGRPDDGGLEVIELDDDLQVLGVRFVELERFVALAAGNDEKLRPGAGAREVIAELVRRLNEMLASIRGLVEPPST